MLTIPMATSQPRRLACRAREYDPGTGGLLRGRERRDQPVDARHDQVDTEDDRRGEQRNAGPDQGADPGPDREDAEGQHPPPMLPDPPDRLGRA
jgi:hypothetical protein